jgi:hypothetical protein
MALLGGLPIPECGLPGVLISVIRCGSDCTSSPTAEKPKSSGKSPLSRFSAALRGCRAGSHGGNDTTEQYERLDIRVLRRAGWHKAGSRFRVGSIRGHNKGNWLVLAWGDRSCCAIRLLRTGCNFGGVRLWLQCPQSDCGRRVGVLYRKGDILACRQCLGLRYFSQRDDSGVRMLRRARALRARLGLSGDFDEFGPKPYRMHRKTYRHVRQLYGMLLVQAFGPVAAAFLADDLKAAV